MKKSTQECRKDCDVYEDWQKLECHNADLVMKIEQLEIENCKLKIIQKGKIGDYRQAIGAAPGFLGDTLPEEIIRKARDA